MSSRLAVLSLMVVAVCAGACASTSHDPEMAAPDELAAPQWPSVAWILTQPYGEACDHGERAGDNPLTAFVAHPDSGRCAFACAPSFAALCQEVQGRCDDTGLCVTLHE